MKIFNDKKKTIKIIIFSMMFIITDFLRVYGRDWIKNEKTIYFIMVIEIFLALSVIWLFILPFLKHRKFYKNIKNLLKKFLGILLKPVLTKAREIHRRKERFIKGSDENKFVWNYNISEKLKKIFKSQEKINLKRCTSNVGKIRLLYIKVILQLLNKGCDISCSDTPNEIKSNLNFKKKEIEFLFSVYEQVRYCEDVIVSDDTVRLYGEALDKIK